jgi:flavin-dependent dehydrogenase
MNHRPTRAPAQSASAASAIVLGASMGGLLAARVLADFYQTVTLIERDEQQRMNTCSRPEPTPDAPG